MLLCYRRGFPKRNRTFYWKCLKQNLNDLSGTRWEVRAVSTVISANFRSSLSLFLFFSCLCH